MVDYPLSESQWRYVRHWLICVIVAETIMLFFNRFLVQAYILIAVLFLIGFLLRLFKFYPGEPKPLILDFSTVLLALAFALAAQCLDLSLGRFILIFCSSAIIAPHFIYIYKNK
ncbi:MAG: hypothetical protein ABIJ41_00815 [Candidatus Omnitrophota bacterium]